MAGLVLVPAALAQSPAAEGFAKQWRRTFKDHWVDTKEYTLAVLDAMPANAFDTKPHPVQRSFGDQLRHLAIANVIYFNSFSVVPVPDSLTTDGKLLSKYAPETDKVAVRSFVVASFDYVSAVLDKLSEQDLARKDLKIWTGAPPHSGMDICMRAYMHTAHHRGQAVVYLRVRGVTPPTWKFEPRGA